VIRYAGEALGDVRQLESGAGLATEPVMFSHTER
jgi:hypothetical protein